MKNLRSISRGYVLQRKGRSLMTGAGVLLGVSLLFAVLVSNASVSEGFDARSRELTGDSDVQVQPIGLAGSVLPPDVVDQLNGLPDVEDVSTWFGVAATDQNGASTSLTGVDDRYEAVNGIPLADGRLPESGADEVLHTLGHGPGIGGAITVLTDTGSHQLAVVGVLDDRGIGELRDSTIRVTSLGTAQRLAGQAGAIGSARVVLADGVNEADWLDDHEYAIAGAQIQDAQAGIGQNIPGMALIFVAGITLFIAAFLIYLTLSGAVLERTAVYGTLRALGTSRKQVKRLVVWEAVILGTVASIGGLLLGLVIGSLLASVIAEVSDLPSSQFTVPPGAVIAAMVVGVGVSALAAYFPARRAGRLSPVVAMRGDVEGRTKLGKGWIAGIVLVLVGLGVRVSGAPFPLPLLGLLLFLAGVVLLIPVVLGPLASLAGVVLNRFSNGLSRVTVMHVAKERNRSSYTTGLILVVLAFGISIGATQQALNGLIDRLAESQADITVLSPNFITEETTEVVRSTPGVATVSPLRFGGTSVFVEDAAAGMEEVPAGLAIVDPDTYFDVQGYEWEDGSDGDARAAFVAGGGVAIPQPFAERLDLGRGDTITLRTTEGLHDFEIIGLLTGTGGGQVQTGLKDGAEFFGAGTPLSLIASVDEGSDAETVRDALRVRLDAGDEWANGGAEFNVAGPEQFRESISTNVNTIIGIYAVLLVVSLVAGVLGMANTLAMAVVQRTREMGVLRALGVKQKGIRRMVVVEAALLTGLAYLLAIPVGLFTSQLQIATLESVGFSAPFAGTGPIVIVLLFVVIAVTFIASWFPARRAARVTVTDAIRLE
jgi:putative ABC transport system permease protein